MPEMYRIQHSSQTSTDRERHTQTRAGVPFITGILNIILEGVYTGNIEATYLLGRTNMPCTDGKLYLTVHTNTPYTDGKIIL
jgi:hypothetical protein